MPNWIANKIKAPKHVIEAMLDDRGAVDFNKIAPFPGPRNEWNGIFRDAEEAAEIVCGIPTSTHPLIASLQRGNRADFDVKKLSSESFGQFIGMLENYRACGYLHGMDYARKVWGTKWNACESSANPEAGEASFDTAWSCPEGILIELSKRFPEDGICVMFADEDIGSNCGTIILSAGAVSQRDVSPPYRYQTEDQKAKWKAFAYSVKDWTPEESEQ